MSILSVAIIGAGNIAGGFDEKRFDPASGIYTHAGAYRVHGGFSLDMVYDPDTRRTEEFCRTWNATKAVASMQEVIDCQFDIVSVCSPDETHFDIVSNLLEARTCKTIFVEKPLALTCDQIERLAQLAEGQGIQLVVNFQRRNEAVHCEIRDLIASRPKNLLSVSGYYIKGLRHIGVTLIDTIVFLCGYPEAVLTHSRVFNQEVGDYSYEFILYFSSFTVSIKTTDSAHFLYNYHIFEIDLLFSDRRMTLIDTARALREAQVTDYAYSGVKVMDDRCATLRETGLKLSMLDAVAYVHAITIGQTIHNVNTAWSSYDNFLIIEKIIESYELGSSKLNFEDGAWRK